MKKFEILRHGKILSDEDKKKSMTKKQLKQKIIDLENQLKLSEEKNKILSAIIDKFSEPRQETRDYRELLSPWVQPVQPIQPNISPFDPIWPSQDHGNTGSADQIRITYGSQDLGNAIAFNMSNGTVLKVEDEGEVYFRT